MVLGFDERAVSDGINVLSSDDFNARLAIVVCRMGPNLYAHLSQLVGHYKGDASGILDRSRGSGALEGTACEIKPFTRIHRVPEMLLGPTLPKGLLCPIGLPSCNACSTWGNGCGLLQRVRAMSVFFDLAEVRCWGDLDPMAADRTIDLHPSVFFPGSSSPQRDVHRSVNGMASYLPMRSGKGTDRFV